MASQYNNIQSVTGDRVWSQMTLKGVQRVNGLLGHIQELLLLLNATK